MKTEEKRKRLEDLRYHASIIADLSRQVMGAVDALDAAVHEEAAAEEAERRMEKITGRGPTIYKCGSKSYVEIPELMEFIKEEKRNFMQGTRPGYIEKKMGRRIAAEYALTKLQTLILRNELDKCRTPDEIREVSMRYRRSEDEL